jgi:hypothetical protein
MHNIKRFSLKHPLHTPGHPGIERNMGNRPIHRKGNGLAHVIDMLRRQQILGLQGWREDTHIMTQVRELSCQVADMLTHPSRAVPPVGGNQTNFETHLPVLSLVSAALSVSLLLHDMTRL